MSSPLVIGITGGICCGKSTATNILKEKCNAVVIDADKLGHEAYEPGTPCMEELVAHFGSAIVTEEGKIDRKALGNIVFGDKAKMNELQSIVWPHIRQKIIDKINELKSTKTCQFIVLEAAVMIEAGWQDLVDTLWVLSVDTHDAVERLKQRNNLSEADALKRINSQLSNEERARFANEIIVNSGDFSLLESNICAAMERYTR